MRAHFILYVKDQEQSTSFYRAVLGKEPRLHVPGMTEFVLSDSAVLGLMPERAIEDLLDELPSPSTAGGVPRAELYLYVEDSEESLNLLTSCGGRLLSHVSARSWGDRVGYGLDPDGHVVAFAEKPLSIS